MNPKHKYLLLSIIVLINILYCGYNIAYLAWLARIISAMLLLHSFYIFCLAYKLYLYCQYDIIPLSDFKKSLPYLGVITSFYNVAASRVFNLSIFALEIWYKKYDLAVLYFLSNIIVDWAFWIIKKSEIMIEND